MMLKAHMNSHEAKLLSISQIPANAGHPLHKGTPREAFIKEFLEGHLSERVAIGSGEIIDCHSVQNPPLGQGRPQIDIVIYKRDYPKLELGGGINAFLAESIVATIEVKSKLTKAELKRAIKAAKIIKQLRRNIVRAFSAGYQPPSILNYVVAYDGPATMNTVYRWITSIHREEDIIFPTMPLAREERIRVASPSIDAVFVLGKGFIQFDNFPIGFISDQVRRENPLGKWSVGNTQTGNVLLLFVNLTQAIGGVSGSWLNPLPYVENFEIPNIHFLE